MTTLALHIISPQPLPESAGQAIGLALRPVSLTIQRALEQAQPERALGLAWNALATLTGQLLPAGAEPAGCCLHLLALEIAAAPLHCLADGTLQEALELHIEHRAWRVEPAEGWRLAEQWAKRLDADAHVAWHQHPAPDGRWQVSAWAPLP